MRIVISAITGGLVGFLLVIPIDILLANAFLDPTGPPPPWADPLRMAINWTIIILGIVLGAIRGSRPTTK